MFGAVGGGDLGGLAVGASLEYLGEVAGGADRGDQGDLVEGGCVEAGGVGCCGHGSSP